MRIVLVVRYYLYLVVRKLDVIRITLNRIMNYIAGNHTQIKIERF